MKPPLTGDELRRADGMLHEAVEQFVHTLHALGVRDAEMTARLIRRRWNQLRGSDCALGRGVHLSNSQASTCIEALEFTAENAPGRRTPFQNLAHQLKEITPR